MFKDMKEMWDWKATVAAFFLFMLVAGSFAANEVLGWIIFGGIVFIFLASMYNHRVDRLEMERDMRMRRRIARKLDEEERESAKRG